MTFFKILSIRLGFLTSCKKGGVKSKMPKKIDRTGQRRSTFDFGPKTMIGRTPDMPNVRCPNVNKGLTTIFALRQINVNKGLTNGQFWPHARAGTSRVLPDGCPSLRSPIAPREPFFGQKNGVRPLVCGVVKTVQMCAEGLP